MTREEMVRKSYKPYMVINYKPKNYTKLAEALLCAVDFDNETMTIQLLDDPIYNVPDDPITVSISCCFFAVMHRNHKDIINQKKS